MSESISFHAAVQIFRPLFSPALNLSSCHGRASLYGTKVAIGAVPVLWLRRSSRAGRFMSTIFSTRAKRHPPVGKMGSIGRNRSIRISTTGLVGKINRVAGWGYSHPVGEVRHRQS